ncbi:isoprenyl transferase [Paenibacillus protaetiae]|uniref:Isoprenyl transferase n=1 Tax=Paenibacillus protaetiae TaxID=2509456 RepID=A0A4P6ET71_9BACL|nr:isoprenyl transferase [Paenibacillus protaetiae]QAY65625.1 isoprenyl transferase [Paenibacillus protaetiae]
MIKRLLGKLDRSSKKPVDLERTDNVPRHVAIIMDGNGRWAKKRGLPRIAGHHSGMKAVKRVTLAAKAAGVEYLTLYAFSTENWKRPKEEVDYLMKLPMEFLELELADLIRNNVQVRMMGYTNELPKQTLNALEDAVRKTASNTGLILNFALNYGSRREMMEAVKQIADDVQAGKLDCNQIDEQLMSTRLLSGDLPDPDLLIRTSGEIRLSNFMLWQLAYSEMWFTEVYWPEFSEEHFHEALMEYKRRARRYGGL